MNLYIRVNGLLVFFKIIKKTRRITNIVGNSIKLNQDKIDINIETRCNTSNYEIYIMKREGIL